MQVKLALGGARKLRGMTSRREFVLAIAALLTPAVSAGSAPSDEVVVYKGPACDCCGGWEKHMRANGFRLRSRVVSDIGTVKRTMGVPLGLWSCHTAVVRGYRVEGHVPASDVRRMLRERPKALGIAVPGMPIGSPGMEQGPTEPYETVAFDAQASWVFQRH
jgi:hypothetical protein